MHQPLLFFLRLPLCELKTSPKSWFGAKKKPAMIPDENIYGLGTQREAGKKVAHYFFVFRRFWVKEPRRSGNISDEK